MVRLAWESIPHEAGDQIQIAGFTHPDADSILATSDGSISVGLGEVSRLSQGSLELSEALAKNYVVRTAFGYADVPGPSEFISLDEFPGIALLAASGWAPDGYQLPAHESIMLVAERARNGVAPGSQPVAGVSFNFLRSETFVAKGDFSRFFEADNGIYHVRLHHRILKSVLRLVLAHELAHLRLQHLQRTQSGPERRRAEAEADQCAIRVLIDQDSPLDHLAALRVFLLLHERERPATAPLSHPYSRDRMQLLARTLAMEGAPRSLRQEVNALLLQLRVTRLRGKYKTSTSKDVIASTDLAFEVASDLDGAELTITTDEPDWIPPERLGSESFDLRIHEVLEISVAYRDGIDAEQVYATTLIGLKPVDWPNMVSHRDRKMHRLFRVRIPTPPMWKVARPGILEITEIRVADERTAVALGRLMIESKRQLVWPYPDEELIAIAHVRAGVAMKDRDPADIIEWAHWLKAYGYVNESIALRSFVIERTPMIAGYEVARSTITDLWDAGQPKRAGDLAAVYVREIPWLRPAMHLALGEAARERGDLLDAFEHAFIEIHGCGEDGPFFQPAQNLFFECMRDRDSREMAVLREWFQDYGQTAKFPLAWIRPMRRRWIRRTIAPLTDLLAAHRKLVSLRQLWAEGLTTLEQAGDREAGVHARRMYDELLGECPWFTAAFVQAAYRANHHGDRERAKQLLRHAEEFAPFHHHVKEARSVILGARRRRT